MSKFKVGDRVKVIHEVAPIPINSIGIIIKIWSSNNAFPITVQFKDDSFGTVIETGIADNLAHFRETELELVVSKAEQDTANELAAVIHDPIFDDDSKPNEGVKHDTDKPMVTLIPVEFILGVARVFTFGAKKYGKHNFRAGMDHSRILDALGRHYLAIINGEDIDPESGEPHWAHLGCCVAMYAYYKVTGKGKDDRYKTSSQKVL
jgi:hypothetical protein